MRLRSLMSVGVTTVLAASALTVGAVGVAPAASATDLVNVLDNPAYWKMGEQADIVQWINMSYGSSHPRYSTHRVDVLLDDGGTPLPGVTYLKLTTNFSVISGTTPQDEFVSALVLPAGVRIVDTKATPIFCRYAPNGLFDSAVPLQIVTDGSCRQGVKDLGNSAFAVNDRVLNRGDIWEVYVPVTSSRALGDGDGAAALVHFASTHATQDATEPAIADSTVLLSIGAAKGGSSASAAKAGAKCTKAGQRSGALKCVKVKGKLIWRHV